MFLSFPGVARAMIGQKDEPEMPKGKDAVDLGRAGFRQVGMVPQSRNLTTE